GYTSSNGSVGRADAGTAERWTLQQMIWCVSNDYECDAVGLDDAAIAELASQTQEEAGWVEVSADAATVTAGSPVRVEVSTNVLGTPIGITTDLADLALCADSPAPATFAGQQLVVDSAAGSPATVALCGVATTPGEATFTAVGITPDDHFQRSDATGLPEGWGACQIYVLWRAFAGQEFGDDAVITVEPAATPEPEESPTTDVPTDETGPTDAPATDAPTTAPAAGTGEGAASDAATDPAQAQGTSGLATTGAGVGTAALVAALLVAAGTAVVLWRRRAAWSHAPGGAGGVTTPAAPPTSAPRPAARRGARGPGPRPWGRPGCTRPPGRTATRRARCRARRRAPAPRRRASPRPSAGPSRRRPGRGSPARARAAGTRRSRACSRCTRRTP